MGLSMKEIGMKTESKDSVSTSGLMVEDMRAIGRTITCMDKDYILGKMVENMMEIIIWIKNMDMEFIIGQMGGNTKASGAMEDSTEKESTLLLMEKSEGVSGKMARE